MIVVTGATGQLGRAIVDKLIERIPATQVGASVRDPEKSTDLTVRGVRVRRGDFSDAASLSHAFEGATQVLIVSSNARAQGGDPLAQHRAAIDAARAVGARRVVYTSHMAASATSAFPPMRDHFATEQMLQQSGLAWTALRNGFYAASGIAMMGDALKTGVLEAPVDGRVSWTAHDDLAYVAAIILADEGKYDGPTPPLTGSEALDFGQLAAIASELLGTPVLTRALADDDLRKKMSARSVPDAVVSIALGMYAASRAGEFATVDPTLERLIGRSPIRMRALLASAIGR